LKFSKLTANFLSVSVNFMVESFSPLIIYLGSDVLLTELFAIGFDINNSELIFEPNSGIYFDID
jgi:hypothetical protein